MGIGGLGPVDVVVGQRLGVELEAGMDEEGPRRSVNYVELHEFLTGFVAGEEKIGRGLRRIVCLV